MAIEGLVTAIGGYNHFQQDQNKLLSLIDGRWLEHYPSMPTSRHYASAILVGDKLIVCGGSTGNNTRINTVDVMDTQTKGWSKGAGLPFPLSSCSCCVVGSELYLVGGFTAQGIVNSGVLACRVEQLLGGTWDSHTPDVEKSEGGADKGHTHKKLRNSIASMEGGKKNRHSLVLGGSSGHRHSLPTTTQSHAHKGTRHASISSTPLNTEETVLPVTLGATPISPWRELADTPLVFSTCAVVKGHLVVVGGMKRSSKKPSGDIYRYVTWTPWTP